MRSYPAILAILTIAGTLSACSGDHMPLGKIVDDRGLSSGKPPGSKDPQEEVDDSTVSFALLHENLFLPRCSRCHQGASAPKGLDLSTLKSAYDNLVGIASKDKPGISRVEPGQSDPSKSYLVAKVIPDGGFRKPPRMPLVGTKLNAEEIEAIRTWIDEGAINN